MAIRQDYAFPLRIDGPSGQTARAPTYAEHVAQLIEQVLLTTPGERVNQPGFGCGLRQVLFAPVSDALQATMQIQVTQALGQALGGVITVSSVAVSTSDGSAALEPGTFQVTVAYTLVDTQTSEQTTVTLI
jgi:hypothetical protein